ncbi:DNA methyltransferase [Candidatus Viridilinea mediisalina]|nr:DNA methyltransferase [Candidatus Viridilinea mediisalina]
MTFADDEARRAYFTDKLREKLCDPEFRKIEGFPLGTDEDILALSDPPYYTACPNPFLEEFMRVYGKPYDPSEAYSKEPFAADVSEGKNDPIYNAHSYHTKVPHKAIMRYILHYTQPGDVILDGFCGTGMTGVAAQLCANPDPAFKAKIEQEWQEAGWGMPSWGARRAILGDLSPAATFIAYNYNTPVDSSTFELDARQLFADFEHKYGWMYTTRHSDGRTGKINFTVWSEVFTCPECSSDVVYYDVAVEKETFRVLDTFECTHCHAKLGKKSLNRVHEIFFDQPISDFHKLVRYKPVLINYQVGSVRAEKVPDAQDLEVIQRIQEYQIEGWFPVQEMPDGERKGKDGYHLKGITHLHHFYFRRALIAYAHLWGQVQDKSAFMRFFVQGNCLGFTKMNRYQPIQYGRTGGSQVNRYFSGTLFVGSLISEVSPAYAMTNKMGRLSKIRLPFTKRNAIVTCQSTTRLAQIPDSVCDYVFVDPPFGNSLHYSELNFFWEAWLNILTNRLPEAVMDKGRQRTLMDYQHLMALAFQELYRVLKPSRWITVEFHNSSNGVWNAIQEAIQRAGFVVADVRTLDKQQETYKQSIQKLVKQDLVISAYKPNDGLEQRFKINAGSLDGAWDFVHTHLRQLPVFVEMADQRAEIINERQNYLLFDRMVAFHVQRGVAVPLSASEFYAGLAQRFPERDGMYFLPEQVAEYERKRLNVRAMQQLEIYVMNEASAIQWIKQQLHNKPQTTAELTPLFMRELNAWPKHERLLELRTLLEENFLAYSGSMPVPAQIVAWMRRSSDLRDVIADEVANGRAAEENGTLTTTNARLITVARDRWYVPDPNRALDLEQLRTRSLLKEFATYLEGSRRLKQFRSEAIKAGFKQAWNTKNYETIVQVAERLPESVVQEDPDLLMYYDNASLRVG